MEADAAKRLALEPGVPPAQELGRYKNFVKVESHRLKILHRAGAGGREICRGRAALMDILLRYLWEGSKATLSVQALKEFPSMALIALGGFGRAELNPHSDIDFMFLHEGQVVAGSKPLPYLSKVMDGILYPLWDLGFKIGHSVRSIADCVQVANSDMQSKTSLIEARLIAGDKKLFEKFQKAVLSKCVEGHEDEYIAARVRDQTARHEKFGNSATMQEPNIKNGCGGLRDFQNLHWMAFFKYKTRSLAEMQAQGLILPAERKQLETAYDFVLSVRNELHYQVIRPVDVLTKALQPTVATHLGYSERSPSKRLENFMRDLYTHSRNIYLITRTLEERLALLPQNKKLPSLRKFLRSPFGQPKEQVVDGFNILDGQIHYVTSRVFKDQPRRLIRVFLYAQQRGLQLHPDLAQLIRSEVALVNREFLKEEHVRETFLEIINQRGNVGRILRRMHEVDFLGKYIPEFGKLTCLVQHEFYHQYAADEHTLVCLEQLDKIWEAKDPPYNTYTELFQSLEKPFILYLALLLHDAGKTQHAQKHSEVGGLLATKVSRRLQLDGATSHSLRLLIEQHLSMAMISQRRDLEDPAVIRSFAAQVQTPENLKMLTILTFADSQATSDKLWNGFKDALLWQLHHKTMQLMMGGVFMNAEEKQRELLAQDISHVLPRSFGQEELEAHFASLPPRYFQITPEREIVTDLTLAHRFMHHQIAEEDKALEPVLVWHNEPDRGYTSAKICTWDRAGLFSKLTGSLSAGGINILSAQIFTRADGIVLDTFFLTDALSGSLVSREARERFEAILFQSLSTSDEIDFRPLIYKQKAARPLYQSWEGERMPTRIYFDNDTSETRTVIDVETEDRVGLLYVISQALTECRLDISLAKILTEKGAAIDTFYVCEVDTQKVIFPERQKDIEAQIRAAIASLDR
ncbi:MAG TPA: [protein-PII] uridylyltransferase [Candidatus Saccharimonadales bacterium]|nr:[protein-PII] uridylyltransferase [Candidatus Saccharimonadales bacterium]